ncbi:MAG: TonB-dependent receptor [Bacteroidetes bacterium]|nr:TonB-dependent receptor [Bacteroidota bacterium]
MAGVSYSQTTRVSLDLKGSTVKEVLKLIENQSEFYFLYNNELIDVNRKVNLSFKNERIDNILNKLFEDNNVEYVIKDRHIILTPVNEIAIQKILKVSGKVTDQNGQPLVGVTISIKGTLHAVITDSNGNFNIELTNKNSILVFSYIGFLTQEHKLTGEDLINIILIPSIKSLDEVVVVGYGTQKKSDVTGAMIRVGEKEMKARPVSNAIEAMQGKAAGVDITSNERPGDIGSITIRGTRSLTASNSPLYVVDGIPVMSSSGIETINPTDIESIDVLKDASATAIYGSRGANGVILVTTKKGKQGKLSFNYSSSVSIENLQDRTKMMTADEYLTWRRWGYYYLDPAKYPRGDQPTQANDKVIFLGANDVSAWNNIMKGWATGTWDGSKVQTTDWAGMVTQTGISNEHNLSVSGGTDKMKAYASIGYLNQDGTMKGQGFTRYTSKVSVDVNPVKWFEMGASINTTFSIQQYGVSSAGGGPTNIYVAANNNLPYAVPYDSIGNRITYPGGDDGIKTVVNEWKYTNNERKMFRALGSLYAQLNILPGLKYRINFGPDFRFYKNGVYIDAMSVSRNGSPNYASLQNQNDFSWTLDNLLYYDKKFGKHTFGATLLQTTSAWNTNYSTISALGIPLPTQKWNALNMTNVSSLNSWDSGLTDRQLMSYMGRFNYGFSDKYLLTISGRWDGASQLAEGHKWAFFPSAALAWRLEQEDWIKNTNWISQLKLRLGVGTTGNSAISPYQTKGGIVSLFYPYGSSITPGYVPSESLINGGNLPMANQDLGWEKTTQYNLGIDFSLFKGRVSGMVDIYTSNTSNLLMQMSIPALTGYTTTYANVGSTKNRGIDMTLTTINIKAKDFYWETSLNAAWQKNEIVSLANGKSDDISNNWFIGQPIGVIYGYASAGLWKVSDAAEMAKFNANGQNFKVGMARPVDQNGDYKIDPNNDRVIIGNTRPRWTVGMTNTFTYKNFDLSVFIFGRLGYMVNTGGEVQIGRYTQRSISYYNENNLNADYQKPIYNVAGGDPYYNILGYRDGSFIKVRDINLGYNIPTSIAKKLGLQTMKVYAQAKNPGMLFSKIDWLDMDTGSSTWNRGFVFGLNVGF